jgi:hypothetical protein
VERCKVALMSRINSFNGRPANLWTSLLITVTVLCRLDRPGVAAETIRTGRCCPMECLGWLNGAVARVNGHVLRFFLRWSENRSRVRRISPLVHGLNLRSTLWRFGAYLVVVLSLHTTAMMLFEGLIFMDALWLTMTTVTTVGYGDFSAETWPGRLSTVLLIYFGGVFVLFEAAATSFEYREARRRRMITGRWRWNMRDHILLLNVPAECPTAYLIRLICDLRASHRYGDLPVLIVTRRFKEGLPEALHELGVVHYRGNADNPAVLEAARARGRHHHRTGPAGSRAGFRRANLRYPGPAERTRR